MPGNRGWCVFGPETHIRCCWWSTEGSGTAFMFCFCLMWSISVIEFSWSSNHCILVICLHSLGWSLGCGFFIDNCIFQDVIYLLNLFCIFVPSYYTSKKFKRWIQMYDSTTQIMTQDWTSHNLNGKFLWNNWFLSMWFLNRNLIWNNSLSKEKLHK